MRLHENVKMLYLQVLDTCSQFTEPNPDNQELQNKIMADLIALHNTTISIVLNRETTLEDVSDEEFLLYTMPITGDTMLWLHNTPPPTNLDDQNDSETIQYAAGVFRSYGTLNRWLGLMQVRWPDLPTL